MKPKLQVCCICHIIFLNAQVPLFSDLYACLSPWSPGFGTKVPDPGTQCLFYLAASPEALSFSCFPSSLLHLHPGGDSVFLALKFLCLCSVLWPCLCTGLQAVCASTFLHWLCDLYV